MPDCPAYPADIQEAEARGFRKCRELASGLADKHGDFCDSEARNGGSRVLFDRAKDAWHIAAAIRALEPK